MYDIISKAEVAKIVTLFLGVCFTTTSPILSLLFLLLYCFRGMDVESTSSVEVYQVLDPPKNPNT